jgi:predicted lipoprotein with Yx(FWY)xxD motif
MTTKKLLGSLVCASLFAVSTLAVAAEPAKMEGGVLVGSNGMTLYTFDKDAAGKSLCTEKCAENWPPLLAQDRDKGSGDYSIILRDNGKKQWAYKGKPLYTWAKDTKPGDKTGDNVNNVWHVAK